MVFCFIPEPVLVLAGFVSLMSAKTVVVTKETKFSRPQVVSFERCKLFFPEDTYVVPERKTSQEISKTFTLSYITWKKIQ